MQTPFIGSHLEEPALLGAGGRKWWGGSGCVRSSLPTSAELAAGLKACHIFLLCSALAVWPSANWVTTPLSHPISSKVKLRFYLLQKVGWGLMREWGLIREGKTLKGNCVLFYLYIYTHIYIASHWIHHSGTLSLLHTLKGEGREGKMWKTICQSLLNVWALRSRGKFRPKGQLLKCGGPGTAEGFCCLAFKRRGK